MRKFILTLIVLSMLFSLCSCIKVEISIEPPEIQASDSKIKLSECTPNLPLVPEGVPNIEGEGTSISKPKVIKQPISENVESGSRTWLISQADDAEGMRWYFKPPEGIEEFNIYEAQAELPGIELETLDKGTLALRNIPIEMDGWSARAEFYNASGSVFSDWAVINVVDTEVLYKPILENLKYIIDVYNGTTTYEAISDPYSLRNCFGFIGVEGAGYMLEDLDNNGVRELIIGYRNGNPEIAGIFTLRDNYPVVLGRSSGRVFLSYAGENKIYYSCGPGGPGKVINTIYEVNGAVLNTVRCCYSFMDNDNVYKSYYSEGLDVVNLEGSDEIEQYRISDSEAQTLHTEIAESVVPVPLTDLIPVS